MNKFIKQKKLLHTSCFVLHEDGYVVSVTTFFILIIMTTLAVSMASLIFTRQYASTNAINSTKSYYVAESGIEDALLRLSNNHQMASVSYALTVGTATAQVVIPAIIGGSRAITSQGTTGAATRNVQAVYSIDSSNISFHYAAQVGAGGLSMANGSQVEGNVFSNGNITGSGTIKNNVIVAGTNQLNGPRVNGNVLARSCASSTVDGNLTYVVGGTNTCTVAGTTQTQSTPIDVQPMPITQAQIDNWMAEATAGGTVGNTTISGTQSLGPQKINGNLTLSNNAILNITGTIYVTGTINPGNGSLIQLDSSYGSLSGVILADGEINMGNNTNAQGSGQAGSYLLVVSTSSSGDAITLNNNITGAMFHASTGTVNIENNVQIKGVSGYRIDLHNNVIVKYESGFEDAFFSDGPGGAWKVTSWREK